MVVHLISSFRDGIELLVTTRTPLPISISPLDCIAGVRIQFKLSSRSDCSGIWIHYIAARVSPHTKGPLDDHSSPPRLSDGCIGELEMKHPTYASRSGAASSVRDAAVQDDVAGIGFVERGDAARECDSSFAELEGEAAFALD